MVDIAELGFRVNTAGLDSADRKLQNLGISGRNAGVDGDRAGGLINRSFRNSAGGIGLAASNMNLLRGALAGLGLAGAFRQANAFEAAMNDVQEKLNATDAVMTQVRDTSLEFGETTAFSASQAAEAIALLAQRGLDSEASLKVLPDVLNLASSSQISLSQAAQLTTDSLSQFGLGVDESTRIVDLLAGVTDTSGQNINELGAALVKVGPRAKSFGVSIEETAAAISILANNGVRAEIAGTGLSAAISRLTKPVGDGEKALAELGLGVDDFINVAADGTETFIGYANAVDIIGKSSATATQLTRILGEEAGKSVAPLFAASGQAIRDAAAATDEASSAFRQAEVQMQGLPGALKTVKSAWEAVNLALIGQEGASLAADALNGLASGLRFLASDAIPRLQPAINLLGTRFRAAITAITEFRNALEFSDALPFAALRQAGSLVTSFGSSLAPIIPFLDDLVIAMAAVATGSTAFGILAGAVGLLTSPIALIGAFAVAVFQIYQNWGGIVEWWSGIWTNIQSIGEDFLAWWRDTTFEQKVADIAIAGIETARSVAESFFDWWDQSTLKDMTPMVIVDGIDRAREIGRGFLQWWDGATFEEKALQIQHAGLDAAREAWTTLSGQWEALTFSEKVLFIPTQFIKAAKIAASDFVTFWNETTLKDYLPMVLVNGIDSAIDRITTFFDWWNATTLEDKAIEVQHAALDTARNAWGAFSNDWESLSFSEKVLFLPTTAIDIALLAAKSFEDFWNNSILREYTPTILVDSIDAAIEKINAFYDWWESTTLRQKIADITFETITRAFEAAQQFVQWWQNLDLKSIILDFEFPSFGDIRAGGEGLLSGITSFGGEIIGGLADGISRSRDHINAVDAIKSDVQFAMNDIPSDVESVGADVSAGLAVGIRSGLDDVKAATQEVGSDGVVGFFRNLFQTRSPSKVTQSIGLDVSNGLKLGIKAGKEGVIESARSLAGDVLLEFENVKNAANDLSFTSEVIRPDQFQLNQAQSDSPAASAFQDADALNIPPSVQSNITAIELYGEIFKSTADQINSQEFDHTAFESYTNRIIELSQQLVDEDFRRFSELESNQKAALAGQLASGLIDAFRQDVGSYIQLNDNMTEAERAAAIASNEVNRKRFEENKKFSIAQSIIATLTGASRAFAELPFFAALPAAAAITAAGLKNISNIRSTTFGGGSAATGSSTSAPTSSSTSSSANPTQPIAQQQQGLGQIIIFSDGKSRTPEEEDLAIGQAVQRLRDNDILTPEQLASTTNQNNLPKRRITGT